MPDYRKVVAPPGLWETPPPTLQPNARGSRAESFVRLVLRPLWGWRLELAALSVAWLVWSYGAKVMGPVGSGVVLLVVAVVASRWPGLRKRVGFVFHKAQLRRRWTLAVRYAGLANHNDRIPKPVGIEAVPAGEQMTVRIPAGSSVTELTEASERVAAFLRVREVRVVRERSDAGRALVSVVRRDPLSESPAIAWPLLLAARLSLVEPIPIGLDEAGRWVKVALLWRNMLIGGEPGAGKSVLLSILVAVAALDTGVRLTLLDGKLVELAVWARCAHRFVGVDVQEAISVLRELQAEMDDRYRWMLARGLRKLDPTDEMPLHVVACDELAHYTTAEAKAAKEFSSLMRDLVSRGRAAGIVVLAATQKPSHETVPTALRDLFGFRLALRCSTRDASDTILGSGWATQGYSAASIDPADLGVGFLRHEGQTPVRFKGCYLSDDDLKSLAARAEALRGLSGNVLAAVLPIAPDVAESGA
jgi:archaellum biogenesis ATPase FlaH